MDAPCVLPWLPATHAVACAETDEPALAVLASAPARCAGKACFGVTQRAPAPHPKFAAWCTAARTMQYAATVLVSACEGGSAASAAVAGAALNNAGAFDAAPPVTPNAPFWLWFARALTRALRACIARHDALLAESVAQMVHSMAVLRPYPPEDFWRDGGFDAAAQLLWRSTRTRCAAIVARCGFLTPAVEALYLQSAYDGANDADPRAFAAFWGPLLVRAVDPDNDRPRPNAWDDCGLERALATGEWRAAAAWLAAWGEARRLDPAGHLSDIIDAEHVWPLCVAAMQASPNGAECRLLRRLVRGDMVMINEFASGDAVVPTPNDPARGSRDALRARAGGLCNSARTAFRLGGQATTTDLGPWLRLCVELHPLANDEWVERRVRRALCANGRRE